jgi:GST-like protein
VECAFTLAGIDFAYEEVDYSADTTRARLLQFNPLAQVPTLVLPDGTVMTESLAMIHWANDIAPKAGLIPGVGDSLRPIFYRWALFLVAAIYPTFTYGDEPKRWVPNEEGAKQLRQSTDEHRQKMWLELEAIAGSPWFLGERRTALDLYVACMTRWRPGRKWFKANTPRLVAIARNAITLPELAPAMQKNFDWLNSLGDPWAE